MTKFEEKLCECAYPQEGKMTLAVTVRQHVPTRRLPELPLVDSRTRAAGDRGCGSNASPPLLLLLLLGLLLVLGNSSCGNDATQRQLQRLYWLLLLLLWLEPSGRGRNIRTIPSASAAASNRHLPAPLPSPWLLLTPTEGALDECGYKSKLRHVTLSAPGNAKT